MSVEYGHAPVMLDACMEALAVRPDGTYVDGTLGRAGHASEIAKRLTTGRLVGIVPIALGYMAYSSFAWPDLRVRDKVGLLSNYAWLCGLAMLAMSFLRSASCDYYSFGLGPIVACIALGAFLGQRSRKQ